MVSTIMTQYSDKATIDHVCVLLPQPNNPDHPKVWVIDSKREKTRF